MTPHETRLAEASEAWKSARTTHGLMQAGKAMSAAIDTAAQEANVRGGEWVMVPREPTNEMLDATREAFHRINDILTTHQVRNGHAVVLSDNEHPPMRNAYVAMLSAAPHPTPAPASGEVTDAMVEAARDVLNKQRCMSGWITPLAARNALEAATRARQGEDYIYKIADGDIAATSGTVAAPNAADAEAYRTPNYDDIPQFNKAHAEGLRKFDIHGALLHAMKAIGCVIPTAAPVPAISDAVKLLLANGYTVGAGSFDVLKGELIPNAPPADPEYQQRVEALAALKGLSMRLGNPCLAPDDGETFAEALIRYALREVQKP